MTRACYTALVGAVGLTRLVEMALSRRNTAWARTRGGVETGRGHFPVMVALHVGLLGGAVAEVHLARRPFRPATGAVMLALVVACQGVRWWCAAALGPRWSTRVIAVPGLAPVTSGPYRFLRHPNYAAVVVEGVALPMVHTAWVTAGLFTVADAALLRVRVRAEREALDAAASAPAPGVAAS